MIKNNPPQFIDCNTTRRTFPCEWKSTYFRHYCINKKVNNYPCPICGDQYDHTRLDYLFGDHIWPYSLMGETSWENYQLLCGSCNGKKKNFINNDLRKILGNGFFRKYIFDYIQEQERDQIISIPENMNLEDYISYTNNL